jgi:hypothetical protein
MIKTLTRFAMLLCVLPSVVLGGQADNSNPTTNSALVETLSKLDRAGITTGILYDRVLPLSGIERFDGGEGAKPVTLELWKQMYYEMYRASLDEPPWPDLRSIVAIGDRSTYRAMMGRASSRAGVVPIALMNLSYERIRADALEKGSLAIENGYLVESGGKPYVTKRVFAAAALLPSTHRGERVGFEFSNELYIANDDRSIAWIEIDFDDGTGYRGARFDEVCSARYTVTGKKLIRVRAHYEGGTVLYAAFEFLVEHLQTPLPHDTIQVTAAVPFEGGYGTGEAYVYLSDLNATITNPVVVVEGFDIDNTMNWDELYQLLNQQELIETLRADGFDAVVLNFTDATDYIQKNAYVVVELVQQVVSSILPDQDIAVIGASMGGLAARYALAYMEREGMEHGARVFISFDAPQEGANIPLGLQYWMEFFSGESAEAAFLRDRLNSPAARQMLVYHFTDPPASTGDCDPLRTAFIGDLEDVGGYPVGLRKVAIANGSGWGTNQGFNAGDQIILYEYSSFLVDITGNVWAVPDGGSRIIFDGLMDLIWPLPDSEMQVTVSGTEPYDNAPGGSRASMTQMDNTEAPYGDIMALHGSHCFIPTISALDLDTYDLFYDIAGDPDIMDITPFDEIYYPAVNEEHITITEENAEWFIGEIKLGITGFEEREDRVPRAIVLDQNYPNPFNPRTVIRFAMPEAGEARLCVFDIRGARVATLFNGELPAGPHEVSWDGRNDGGAAVASGVYFCRLEVCGGAVTRTMVLLR